MSLKLEIRQAPMEVPINNIISLVPGKSDYQFQNIIFNFHFWIMNQVKQNELPFV